MSRPNTGLSPDQGPSPNASRDISFTLSDATHLVDTTDGQHLYVHHPMLWRDYKRLIGCLARNHLVDRSWARAALRTTQSVLPAPWLVNTHRPAGAPKDLPETEAEREITRHRFMLRPDTRTDLRVHRPIKDTTLRYTRLPAKATHVSSLLTGRNTPPLHAPALPMTVPTALTSTGIQPVIQPGNESGTEGAQTVVTFTGLNARQQRRLTKALIAAALVQHP